MITQELTIYAKELLLTTSATKLADFEGPWLQIFFSI